MPDWNLIGTSIRPNLRKTPGHCSVAGRKWDLNGTCGRFGSVVDWLTRDPVDAVGLDRSDLLGRVASLVSHVAPDHLVKSCS